MSNSGSTTDGHGFVAADDARVLLKSGGDVSIRVREAIDARTSATAEAWMAVATLIYALTFILAGSSLVPGGRAVGIGPGGDLLVLPLLLTPFLTAVFLEGELRTQLLAVPSRASQRHGRLVSGANATALIVILWIALFSEGMPWPALLGVVVLAALPLSILALRSSMRARAGGARWSRAASTFPLSWPARVVTLVLGILFGLLGVVSGLSSTATVAGSIAGPVVLLLLLGSRGTRWGVTRLAEEWGRTQWAAFGASFVLINGLAVVFARTGGDLLVVGVVGGICVAAPLLICAFLPAPVRGVE